MKLGSFTYIGLVLSQSLYIWDSKSLKDRTIPLPLKLKQKLEIQIETVCEIHKKDLNQGYGTVFMPFALEKKYPNLKSETKWQFLFPMTKVSKDPRSQTIRRHHIHPKTLGRNISSASKKANIFRLLNKTNQQNSFEYILMHQ